MRICARPGCKEDASPRGARAKYCSVECQHMRRVTKGGKPPRYSGTCAREGCDNPWVGSDSRKAYCSPSCASIAATDMRRQAHPRRERRTHPTGWEPGYELNGAKGVVTSRPVSDQHDVNGLNDWDWLLDMHGLDPAKYRVVPPVNARTWDAAVGDGKVERFYYYKADIELRQRADVPSFEELRQLVLAARPRARTRDRGGEAFVIVPADLQLGKADGDGTAGTVRRFRNAIEDAAERIESLRSAGVKLRRLVVVWPGDNVENIDGHYAQQLFSTDLNLMQQFELAADLAVDLHRGVAPLFGEVLDLIVPGNHGEVRKDGKSHTAFSDNMDVSSIRMGLRRLAENKRAFGHVRFLAPEGESLTVTAAVEGHILAVLHGHQGKVSAPTAHAKIVRWFEHQAIGLRAPGEAEYIISGHYHHFAVTQVGPRTFFQAPALDGGSTWYAESVGLEAPPGMLTMVIGRERGWHDLEVLRGDPLPPQWTNGSIAL